ncbi:hypothetical protein RD792_008018 [Penstemon davidsonii]|uniref:Protein kinase domain-containing protein n=1 Tax=Penstemon davidsonii TaxID=160366 RepID=A0ABR0D7Y0_9LAMI|nr:hypothetical protein RD792_008018 [Penstemon davidsonii]
MAKQRLFLTAIVYSAILIFQATAVTDELDVQALRDLYRSLNSPWHLNHWKIDGGDPCGESWMGVECFESSVIHIKLQRLNLTGNLGYKLSDLRSLKQLDLSSNNIEGSIPYSLPLNVTHLNLSHNALSGSLGDVFNGLVNMKEMDLSFNSFTGDLPTSFSSLANLTGLNIEDNHFSGVIPEKFQAIHNLWIGGNKFDKITNYPPWSFPSEIMPVNQNITSPPATNLSAFESHPSQSKGVHKKKRPHTGGIVLLVSGLTLIVACGAIAVVVHRHRARKRILQSFNSSEGSMKSLPISTVQGIDFSSMTAEDSPHISAISTSPMITPSRLPPIRTRTMKTSRRKSFSKSKMPINAKAYTVAELQIATNGFSEENLLGEGSLGSVYRAEFPDSLILAVKNINTVPLSIIEEEQFLDVVRSASRLRHPNIVTLIGYCMEHGQHLIIYEFIKNLSLEDALHCAAYKPLSWGLRLRIAVGIARALSYMHSSIVPPMAHSNLKAGNILLDEELMPHLCDCGLAILKPLSSNSVKLKASEMAIADGGYIAPEHVQPGIANTKADVYAFGVLLLELLTGRRPFDNSRPKSEQSLVKWASSKLHDSATLGQMVDPATSRTVPSKSLSRFADIVSMCIQPEQEYRPPMSEVKELLMTLLQKPGAVEGTEADPFDRSFRSTNSRFFGSPSLSYYSV